MSTKILITLNRRLDSAFQEMETAWKIYKADRADREAYHRYLRTLKRADTLHQLTKSR